MVETKPYTSTGKAISDDFTRTKHLSGMVLVTCRHLFNISNFNQRSGKYKVKFTVSLFKQDFPLLFYLRQWSFRSFPNRHVQKH